MAGNSAKRERSRAQRSISFENAPALQSTYDRIQEAVAYWRKTRAGSWLFSEEDENGLTIHDKRDAALRFYLMVGDAEPKAKQAGHAFAGEVHAPDQATLVNIPGGHNWNTWNGNGVWYILGMPGGRHRASGSSFCKSAMRWS